MEEIHSVPFAELFQEMVKNNENWTLANISFAIPRQAYDDRVVCRFDKKLQLKIDSISAEFRQFQFTTVCLINQSRG